MSHDDVMGQIREIMLDVFDLDELTITDATTAKDVEDWDSLSHIRLVVSLEKHFGIRFTTAEIESFENVGALVRGVSQKLPA